MPTFSELYNAAPYSFGDHGDDSPRMRLFREAEKAKEVEMRNNEAIASANQTQASKAQSDYKRDMQFQQEADALNIKFENEVVANSPDAESLYRNTMTFARQNPSFARLNPDAFKQGQNLFDDELRLSSSKRAAARDQRAFEWEEKNQPLLEQYQSAKLTSEMDSMKAQQEEREKNLSVEDGMANDHMLSSMANLPASYDIWLSKRMTWANGGGTPAERVERRTSLSRFITSVGIINNTLGFATNRFQLEHSDTLSQLGQANPELLAESGYDYKAVAEFIKNKPVKTKRELDLFQDLQALESLIQTKEAADEAMGLKSLENLTGDERTITEAKNNKILEDATDTSELNAKLMIMAKRLEGKGREFADMVLTKEQLREKARAEREAEIKQSKLLEELKKVHVDLQNSWQNTNGQTRAALALLENNEQFLTLVKAYGTAETEIDRESKKAEIDRMINLLAPARTGDIPDPSLPEFEDSDDDDENAADQEYAKRAAGVR
jgi:hypothetical protein